LECAEAPEAPLKERLEGFVPSRLDPSSESRVLIRAAPDTVRERSVSGKRPL